MLERCKLINVSDDGALLSIDDVYDLPNQFRLRLIRESPAVLNCKVIWQRDKKVGVQFLQSRKTNRAAPTHSVLLNPH